jgi:NAD(P)-dependent dehydrogenase (short-subunit alcohol dehydrogenase family)
MLYLFSGEYKLDILINSAGVMFYPYNLTADRYETTLATNHLGLYVMVN